MSVQRWEIHVDNALMGVTAVRKVVTDNGDWVEYQDHAADVARLREAARKVLECADKGIGIAKLSADDTHWLCPRCNAKGTCKPGCALNALLGALDELAAIAPAARKEDERG